MIARLVECTDHDIIYGVLTVKGIDVEIVQKEIYKIKRGFSLIGYTDWTIDDVFEEFPKEWEWHFISYDSVIEI